MHRQLCYSQSCPDYIQGSAELYVQVLDYDGGGNFQHVDDIYVPISINPGSAAVTRTTTGEYNRGMIELSFQLECWREFYGRNCSIFCRSFDDDVNGHFICQNGERVCRTGWKDPGNRCLTRKFLLLLV